MVWITRQNSNIWTQKMICCKFKSEPLLVFEFTTAPLIRSVIDISHAAIGDIQYVLQVFLHSLGG